MPALQSWDCPICLRHVPAKVDECYCGYKHSDTPVARPASAGAGPAVIALAALALGGGFAWWMVQPPPVPAGVPATTLPRVAGGLPAHHPVEVPPSTTLPAAWKALAIEATPTPAPGAAQPVPVASPTPAAQATPDDSIDAKRAAGAAELESALGTLAAQAADYRQKLKQYQAQCAREDQHITGCEGALSSLQDLAHQIASDVEAADETARRSWVEAGQRRNLRESKGLDEPAVRELVQSANAASHH